MLSRRRRPFARRRRVRAADLAGLTEQIRASGSLIEWTEAARVIREESMVVPPLLREIYECTDPFLVVRKAAQMGATEFAINLALWCADTGYAGRGNVVYYGPTDQTVNDIAQSRIRRAVDDSPYLKDRFGNGQDPASLQLFRLGIGYVYARSAGSDANLHAVDADVVILDEFDRMDEDILPTVRHRLDSSEAGRLVVVSTPTHPDHGVDRLFLEGDQRLLVVDCGACHAAVEVNSELLDVVPETGRHREGGMLCPECGARFEESIAQAWATGEGARWVARNPDGAYPSYWLSHLHALPVKDPHKQVEALRKRLRARDPATVRQTYNQDLGLAYSFGTDHISKPQLRRLAAAETRTLRELRGEGGYVFGVDVGRQLHCVVLTTVDGLPALAAVEVLNSFQELRALMSRFVPRMMVVDAAPELHAAEELARVHEGRVYLAEYVRGVWPARVTGLVDETGQRINDSRRRYRVQVDRTAAIDQVASLLQGTTIEMWGWQRMFVLPRDAEQIPDLFNHLSAPVRVIERRDGMSPVARWEHGSRPDHLLHALVYALLARDIDPNHGRLLWSGGGLVGDPPMGVRGGVGDGGAWLGPQGWHGGETVRTARDFDSTLRGMLRGDRDR